jgi:hypothetical protein
MKKPILADLHTHLIEKNVNPKDYWKAVENQNLRVIAITEHVEYNPKKAYEELVKIKPKNVILIPGMEAKTTAGHLLIYGEDKSIYDIKDIQTVNIPIENALKIINENKLVASFAHPYGYKTDSTCLLIGEKKTKRLLKKYKIGTEYYNGMLGSATNLVFGNQWVKKTYDFFDFLANNKGIKKIKIIQAKNFEDKLYNISKETFLRVKNGMIFSQNAEYITTGSDAHYPRNIGRGVIELKKNPKDEKEFLKMIQKKEILWAGPNIYIKEPVSKVKKIEILMGLKYVTKKRLNKDKTPKERKIKFKEKFDFLISKTKKRLIK